MRNAVIRNIPRADEATIRRLGECGMATVHEAMSRVGLMQPYMRPIYDNAAVAGSAVTVLSHPGDVIVADDDGVVVVPVAEAGAVLAACEARLKQEESNRKRLASGELGLDIYGMRGKLAAAGMSYVDE